MLQRWGAATLPHELMAAKAEIEIAFKKPNNPIGGGGNGTKVKEDKKKDEKDKRMCTTWNSSETRGKCSWETEHEGETCNRVHVCSWCKSKNMKPLTHQKRFCRKRMEEDGE